MIQRPTLLFRGLHALVWHEPDHNRKILEQYLHRLGLSVSTCKCDETISESGKHDLLFFDSDRDLPLEGMASEIPKIAVVGSEAPSRLEWVLHHSPGSMIFKPVRSAGIYASIVFAMSNFEHRGALLARLNRLEKKIRYRKLIVFATIRVMQANNCTEAEAFDHLRRKAMNERLTIESLCADIIVDRGSPPVMMAHRR